MLWTQLAGPHPICIYSVGTVKINFEEMGEEVAAAVSFPLQ